MQQNIRYKGLSLTPDEMAAENGALSLCGNLELHDGALRPAIVAGTKVGNLWVNNSGDTKLVYVHEASGYKHFIGYLEKENSLHWFDEDCTYMDTVFSLGEGELKSVTSIGNTLVIICSDGIRYALFERKNGSGDNYLCLGQKPPFLELSFTISNEDQYEDYSLGGVTADGSKEGFNIAFQQTTLSCGDAFKAVNGSTWNEGDHCVDIIEDKQSDITQSIYALVNRTNNLIARHGRFYANFFVRYCYRMFDGSMVMHSSPVFIPVKVPENYSVICANALFQEGTDGLVYNLNSDVHFVDEITFNRKDATNKELAVKISKAAFIYKPRNVALRYSLKGEVDELKKWGDIIKSVDVFITPPVTNIDTSEKISSLIVKSPSYSLGYGQHTAGLWGVTGKTSIIGMVSVAFPTISDDAYLNKLKNTSAFYRIASLKVSEIKEITTTDLPVDKASVYQISLQEQMKDDYKTHNHLYADGSYVYNHRLNLFGVKEKLFEGFSRDVMFPGGTFLFLSGNFMEFLMFSKIVVVINTSSGKKYVEKTMDPTKQALIEPRFLANTSKFYPDSRAERMVFFCTDQNNKSFIYSFELEACNELNGAIFMGTFAEEPEKYQIESFSYMVDDMVDMSNKIYTSEADNAFYFPLNGINTVGIGTIKGIASATRALSQGQFGQYPLMAFSTDGIWALDVSSSGTYSSIHPISREVCSNPGSITQLDQSVLFATNRSLSRVAESQVVSMSDVLDGPGFDIAGNLGKLLDYFSETERDDETVKTIKSQMRQLIGFTSSPIDFFQKCQVVYDYKNSRIFCLDVGQQTKEASADTIALCYSIRDEAWSTFLIKNVLTAVNSYPNPYIQYRDGSVTVLDRGYDYDNDTGYHGIIVTRTLKFDEENAPDAITGYIHSLTSGTAPVMWLYGSNDNQNWHYLGRVGGIKSHYMNCKSYRYFRIAIYLYMKATSQYLATRLEIIRRFSKF